MSHLLDTHALLWWFDGDPRLSKTALGVITNRKSPVYVSAATAWEIANKARIGKLQHAMTVAVNLLRILPEEGFEFLPVSVEHGYRAGWLPTAHKDPFDRILAAQAIIEGLGLVTSDQHMAAFGAKVVW